MKLLRKDSEIAMWRFFRKDSPNVFRNWPGQFEKNNPMFPNVFQKPSRVKEIYSEKSLRSGVNFEIKIGNTLVKFSDTFDVDNLNRNDIGKIVVENLGKHGYKFAQGFPEFNSVFLQAFYNNSYEFQTTLVDRV
jgi:hypothetical protein